MKPTFLLLLLAAVVILPSESSPAQPRTFLYPIVEKGKWGYINETGQVLIKPQFDDAKPFYEGLARVKIGKKWGFIDPAGKLTIAAQFELGFSSEEANNSSLDFHEGMAVISLFRGEKWGYLDRTGKIIVAPKYDLAERFSEGLALVGNTYSEAVGQATAVYHGGAARYIDKTGKTVALPLVGDTFSEGLAIANVPRKRPLKESDLAEGQKIGYIDKTGHFQIAPRLWAPYGFSEGLARVRAYDRDEWGYIDHKGTLVIKKSYEDAGDFSEGLARVKLWGQMGFINKAGAWAIRPGFLAVGNFSGGLASACQESATSAYHVKCGYLDKTGGWAIKPTFIFMLGDFKGKLAFACTEEICGYINRSGEFAWSVSVKPENGNKAPIMASPLTGCSIMSDKYYESYPCTLGFKLF
jgi:WG containing repeat